MNGFEKPIYVVALDDEWPSERRFEDANDALRINSHPCFGDLASARRFSDLMAKANGVEKSRMRIVEYGPTGKIFGGDSTVQPLAVDLAN